MYIEAEIQSTGMIIPNKVEECVPLFESNNMINVPVILKIDKFRRQRSNRQNRYIWGVVVPRIMDWILETQGERISKDQAYMYIRTGVLEEKPVIKDVAGTQVITLENRRLSQRTTAEFAEAIEEIVSVMAQRGCIIPLPREENLLTDFL